MPSNTPIEDSKYALTKEDFDRLAQHKKFRDNKLREESLKKGAWDSDSIQKEYGFG
jgi:hypothetical protein